MATYKVLQDIEAEDKLLGPLTLKQFIFAAVFIGLGFIGFSIIASGAPAFLKAPFVAVLVPFMLIFGFMAAPIGRDQSNDLWLLARLRFLFKPRRRIWSQDGLNELVTITAPKRVIRHYTDGLDQTEVKSRLRALASTMDTRGWAVKNVNANLFAQPGYLTDDSSDRLVAATTIQDSIVADIEASDDIFDTANSETAQHFDQLVQESGKTHRTQALEGMKGKTSQAKQTQDYWFMHQNQPAPQSLPGDYSTFGSQPVVQPGTATSQQSAQETPEEKELARKLAEQHKQEMGHVSDHMKTIQPLHDRDGNIVPRQQPVTQDDTSQAAVAADDSAQVQQSVKPQPKQPNPAILELAHNDDLNISTIARQANQSNKDDDEVVISLH